MIKIDLHTHSIISSDGAGSITASDYERLLKNGVLQCIAITDHNEIKFAQIMHKKLSNQIIVGEEITTTDGEMIGLFLERLISPGLSAKQTAKEIHSQGGLVYIPHPFETFRKGIKQDVMDEIVEDIDIFEIFNGRGRMRGKTKQADLFAKKNHLIAAASSDAHGFFGIGKTFSIIDKLPDKKSLKRLLQQGSLQKTYAPLFSYLYPTLNMIKNKIILTR